MKSLIITTFVLGLSANAFAANSVNFNSYEEGGIMLISSEQVLTSGTQPQVGSSSESGLFDSNNSVNYNSYEEGGIMLISSIETPTSGAQPQVGSSSKAGLLDTGSSTASFNSYEEGGIMLID